MKKNRVLLVCVCVLSVIIVAVLAQSYLRRNQQSRVAAQVKQYVNQNGNNAKSVSVALYNYKDDIEFVKNHQPIINLKPKYGEAAPNPNDEYCDGLWEIFLDPQVGVDNVNDFLGETVLGPQDYDWIRSNVLNQAAAIGCAL